jgi:hypothetical protein
LVGAFSLGAVERLDVDDVAVGWRSAPGPLRAELLFAVGIRDETLDTLGVTDAVAALAATVLLQEEGHGGWM